MGVRHPLAVCLVGLLLGSTTSSAQEFLARVIGVADGDTITVLRDQRPVTIRLDGIDCPEGGQDFSQRAKAFTSQMVFEKSVTVVPKEIDKYRRLVARVIVDGQDVSLALVKAGMAWHYVRYSNDKTLATAEVAARQARVGLWSQGSPIPPWEFRQSPLLSAAGQTGPIMATSAVTCSTGLVASATTARTARLC